MLENVEDIIAKQQAILDEYFNLLGNFAFDKAKEFLEKERDAAVKNHTVAPFFSSALSAFAALAPAEKSYSNLLFLGQKSIFRNVSSLKSAYESLLNEYQKLEEKHYITPVSTPTMSPTSSCRTPSPLSAMPPPSPISACSEVSGSTSASSISIASSARSSANTFPTYLGEDILENLASHLCGQLVSYVKARLRTMEFYEKMFLMSQNRFMKFDQLLIIISDIVKSNLKLFHHPMLSPLKSSFSSECEILVKLLEADIHMQNWRFMPSLLCLHDAHSKLGAWISFPKDIRKSVSSTSYKSITPPVLYNWLRNLKSALISKFSLYFHENLSKQTTPTEMKSFCSKTSVDYFSKIMSFQKRHDVACIAIVLDTNGLEGYAGHGYVCPGKGSEAPKGLDSFPPIVSYPPNSFTQEKYACHWPAVVMIMNNKEQDIRNTDNGVSFYDPRMNATYFMSKIEARMTLVVIFECKRTSGDKVTQTFIQTTVAELRGNKLFQSLKPGSK